MSEDLITSIVLRGEQVEWTSVRVRKGRAEVVDHQTKDLEWPEDIEDRWSAEAAAHLKTKLSIGKSRIGLSVPTDKVLMRVARFPTTDIGELHGMAELQADKFSPFPVDQMYTSLERFETAEDQSSVLVAAVHHEQVDHLGDLFAGAGLQPAHVDVEVMGWWHLLEREGRVERSGQEMFIIIDDHCMEVIITRLGIPYVFCSLDATLDPAGKEGSAEIAEEIEFALTTMEGQWGPAETSHVHIWSRQETPSNLADAMQNVCPAASVEGHQLRELPPLSEGLADRMAATDYEPRVDLAPPGWTSTIESKKHQKTALVAGGIMLGIWLAVIGTLGFLSSRQRSLLADAEASFSQLQTEVDEVRELQRKVESLERYGSRDYSSLECLREISAQLPNGVDLSQFNYRKDEEVRIRGEAGTSEPIYTFFSSLEKATNLFAEIRPDAVSQRVSGGRPRSTFSVTAVLSTRPAEPQPGGDES